MLDENKEYKQYTSDVEGFVGSGTLKPRLQYFSLIKKNFSGIVRALTTISRYVIFDKSAIDELMDDGQTPIDSEHKGSTAMDGIDFDMNRVQAVLRAWMGFDYKNKNEYAQYAKYVDTLGVDHRGVDHWLEKYIRTVFLNEAFEKCKDVLPEKLAGDIANKKIKNENLRDIRNDLQELEKKYKDDSRVSKKVKDGLNQAKHTIKALYDLRMGFRYAGRRMFVPEYKPMDIDGQDNTYRELNFEKIIATAYSMGALKTYFLVCKNANFWKVIKKYTDGNPNHGKNLLVSDKELILKLTVAFILQKQNGNQEQEYMAINQMDIANWLETKANPQKFELEKYRMENLEEKAKQLFVSTKINDNVKKLWIAPSWGSMFRLETKEEDIKAGEIFFADEDLGSKSNKGKGLEGHIKKA